MESRKSKQEYSSWFNDTEAIELIEKIDYDFSRFEENLFQNLFMVARAKQLTIKYGCISKNILMLLLLISGRGLTQRFTASITGWFNSMTSICRTLLPSENNWSPELAG